MFKGHSFEISFYLTPPPTRDRFKRIAFRCEKTEKNYSSIVAFACAMILIKSVRKA
jgi:hypothetical protein